MELKRTASFLMAMLLTLLAGICGFMDLTYAAGGESIAIAVPAEKEGIGRYYFEQLPDEAKSLYLAMYNMYEQGIFKTGTGDYDLVANGHVTQEQLDGYANGNMTLLSYMGAARDAFYADYPEIFYVDFSLLTLRVTQAAGKYCAYLGPGRKDNYFVYGFTGKEDVEAALAEYNARMDEILSGAEKLTPDDGRSIEEEKIQYAHDEIIRHTSYRLENTCTKGNGGHIRTAYGALVKGESLCEGYARAVKDVLDKMAIPCVLVQGGYQSSEGRTEPHMWNYVQVGDEWYGLDATMDDPISPLPGENGMDGLERSDYLIVGNDVMGKRHLPDGVMSECDFEFSYPEIAGRSLLFDEVFNSNGLKVEYNEGATEGDLQTGIYKVSYNGMGAAKTIESGKYMLMKETKYYPNTKRWEYGRWAYILPDVYMMKDTDEEAVISVPGSEYVEFAVTSKAPGNYNTNEGGSLENLAFHGDSLLYDAYTEILYNPSGTYTPPPYVKRATPSNTTRIYIGKTYHMTLQYDENLKRVDEGTKPGIHVSVLDENSTALDYCKVGNFKWNGTDTVEFDFTPSEMWLDDCVSYTFETTGLIGVDSEKAPKSVSYTAAYKTAICAYRSQGYYFNLFGKPRLLENSDLSQKNLEEWKTESGEGVTPDMVTGLTLVTTSPSHKETDAMNDLIEDAFPQDNVLKSETYNIRFLICRQSIVTLGSSIRLSVGFPKGYGPDDEGVTFKAYHFKRDKYGEIMYVEEVPCVITRYGLVITCKSFSPFAIVAVEDDGKNQQVSKSVILSNSQGGRITGAEGVLTLKAGESKKLEIQAEQGYVIDSLVVGGKYQAVTDKKSMTVNAAYDGLTDGDIIEAQFVAEAVRQKEVSRGESVVTPKPSPANVSLNKSSLEVPEKGSFEILSKVTGGSGNPTYQWYKDGVALPGKKGAKLRIESATVNDSGNYTVVVTTAAGAASADARSAVCRVTVNAQQTQVPNLAKAAGLKASSVGEDKVKLKWNKVIGADGYEVWRYDASRKKFVKAGTSFGTSFTDRNCSAGTSYRYKVKAYKAANGKTYYGRFSVELKSLTKPKTPAKVSLERLTEGAVLISFQPVSGAKSYEIYKYNKGNKKYKLAYQVKGKKLYQYNSRKKKWTYLRKIRRSPDGKITARLTGMDQEEKNQKYYIRTFMSRKGYPSQYSGKSKVVKVK